MRFDPRIVCFQYFTMMELETKLFVLEHALNTTTKERLISFVANSHVFINSRVTRLRQGCGCCGCSAVR